MREPEGGLCQHVSLIDPSAKLARKAAELPTALRAAACRGLDRCQAQVAMICLQLYSCVQGG